MPRITISYRRDDSGVITGRIFDRLAGHYGREAVFRDIDNIPPGVDFRAHISRILDESDIVLAIVGPRWIGPRAGQSRLTNAADPVRVEIETALLKDRPVIPVLVLRGSMPRVEQLPESLHDFAYRHAVSIDSGQDFDVHMARLIRAMDRSLAGIAAPAAEGVPAVALGELEPPASAETERPGKRTSVWRLRHIPRRRSVAIALGVIFVLILLAGLIFVPVAGPRTLTGHTDTVTSVAFSPDGRTLASASNDFTIKLWDAASGRLVRTLTGHLGYVQSVRFSPDGRTVASASDDKTIKLWDVASGQVRRTLTGHTDAVLDAVFSPDGRTLGSESWDMTVRLWDVESGELLRTLTGHTGYVQSLAFSPDGRTLASGGDDRTIKLWDGTRDHGELLRTLSGHTDSVLSVAFSPDGRVIASGSADRTIKLWSATRGQVLRTLIGHTDAVNSVVFSPDGRTLASASADKSIKLWDPASGQALRTLTGHTDSVEAAVFSPDGRMLASGSADNTVRLWEIVPVR